MTLQQLEYALSLKKLGSFTKSSKELLISQPALSLQIKNLEEELDIVLFDRSSSPIRVSEDGEQFLLRAEEIVRASENLKDYASQLSKDFVGTIKIGIIPTLSPFLVPLFISQLTKDYPKLELNISELLTEQIVEKVRSGDLDAGIVSTPIQKYGIQSNPLFYENFYLYHSNQIENYPNELTALDMMSKNIWLLNEGNCFRDQVNDICSLKREDESKLVYNCNSIDSLIRIVDHYGGATILPELTTLSLDAEQENYLIPFKNKVREIGLIKNNVPHKERFISLLEEYITKNIPSQMREKGNREIVDPRIQED